MKKILVLLPLITLLGLAELKAQVSVSVNIGSPPAWGPYGYEDARYYFIPDIDVYYDVRNGTYLYYDYGAWVSRPYLPKRFSNYDLYGSYKVVLDYRGADPYRYHNTHRTQYARYKQYKGPKQYTYKDKGGYKKGPVKAYNNGGNNGNYKGNDKGYKKGNERVQPQSKPAYNNRGNGNSKPANKGGGPQKGNKGKGK